MFVQQQQNNKTMFKSYYITEEDIKKYSCITRQERFTIARSLNVSEELVRAVLKAERKVTKSGLRIIEKANELI